MRAHANLGIVVAIGLFAFAAPAVSGEALEKPEIDDSPQWQTPLPNGAQTIAHLLTAISAKRNSEKTQALMNGVMSIVREENDFRLVRSDGQQLIIPRDTKMGERMFAEMDKLERDAREKVNNEMGQYIHNLDSLTVQGNDILLHHLGPEELHIPLPGNQPWLPVHLKELRLNNIRMHLVEGHGAEIHRIKQISGIAAVVVSAGIDISIEPREYWRWKDKRHRTHITFGIKSAVPKPIRELLRMPEVLHFHFTFKKRHERAEMAEDANNSGQEAPRSAHDGPHGN